MPTRTWMWRPGSGSSELMPSTAQRLFAEWLGTALLLAAVVGSGIMAQKLANGNGAIALLCNTIATGAILVVLILMGLVAVLVAPALLPHHHDQSDLNALLGRARELAARRGEIVYVHIDPTGEWRMEAGANLPQGPFATGRVQPFLTAPVTLMVSPLGSCGVDPRSAAAVGAQTLDPLTCEIRSP